MTAPPLKVTFAAMRQIRHALNIWLQLESSGLEAEVNAVVALFTQKETEDNWIQMDEALSRYVAITKGTHMNPHFLTQTRKLKFAIERGVYSCLLANNHFFELMIHRFEGLADFILPALLRLCVRASKIVVTYANNALKAIIDAAGVPSLVSLLMESICAPSPSKSLRISAAECLNRLLVVNTSEKLERQIANIEACIKSGSVDSTPEVRGLIKSSFEKYKELFPARLERFTSSLPDVALKYLKVSKPAEQLGPISRKAQLLANSAVTASGGPQRQLKRTMNFAEVYTGGFVDDDCRSVDSETPSFNSDIEPSINQLQTRKAVSQSDLGKAERVVSGANDAKRKAEGLAGDNCHSLLHKTDPMVDGHVSSAILMEHGGGAKRIPAPKIPEAPNAGKPKAVRIPATANNDPGTKEKSDKQTGLHISKPALISQDKEKPKVSQSHNIKSSAVGKSIQKSIDINFDSNRALSSLKNSDWTVRLAALENAKDFVNRQSQIMSPDSAAKVNKCFDVFMLGLSDYQVKCVQGALEGLLVIFSSTFFNAEMANQVVPRVAGLIFHQPTKSKDPSLELGHSLLRLIKEKVGVTAVALASVFGLTNSEWAKNAKIRSGCSMILCELKEDDWRAISAKSSNIKAILTRLLAISVERDLQIQKSVKSCILNLQKAGGDMFWNAWIAAKPSEKKAITALFQASGITFTKTALGSMPNTDIALSAEPTYESMSSKSAPSPSIITPSCEGDRAETPTSIAAGTVHFIETHSIELESGSVESTYLEEIQHSKNDATAEAPDHSEEDISASIACERSDFGELSPPCEVETSVQNAEPFPSVSSPVFVADEPIFEKTTDMCSVSHPAADEIRDLTERETAYVTESEELQMENVINNVINEDETVPDISTELSLAAVTGSIETEFQKGFESLWLFVSNENNANGLDKIKENFLDSLLSKIECKTLDYKEALACVCLIKAVMASCFVEHRASDILAIIVFFAKHFDEDLEFEYEVDDAIQAYQHAFGAKVILGNAISSLRSTSDVTAVLLYLNLARVAYSQLYCVEENNEDMAERESQTLEMIVDLISSSCGFVRKTALDLAICICERKGQRATEDFLGQVESKKGPAQRMLTRQMMEKLRSGL
ncbi:hypothetical protein HDU84_002420 [Entophlyctis sp. JEL0112]|nr:hypothetical protein HDU84_002420 [Entophlyctis sp. JEL0112]